MKVNPLMFRNYERGIVDEDLTPEIVEAIGKAYGSLLHRRKIKQVVVGRDYTFSVYHFRDVTP